MPLRTRRPVIIGSQPAKVVSTDNQEIDVDKLGRVLVEFYWDPQFYGEKKRTPSRRVRVGQFWAGIFRGALFIPRVGDEVMVEYENGDPDRPIIVGSVYNGNNDCSHYSCPTRKTRSGILTKSTPNSNGYNMLSFNDAAGQETVKLRAQRDLMFKALANEQRDIGGSQTENVGGDETINVGGPTGGGNFTLNAFQTVTINVGPAGVGTQIKMDASSITLSVGPGGLAAQIKMDASGVTISGTPVSQLKVQPSRHYNADPIVELRDRAGDFHRAGHDSHRQHRRRHGRRRFPAGIGNRRCPRASASPPRAMCSRRSRI